MDDSAETPALGRYVAPMKWLGSRRTCNRSRMAPKRNALGPLAGGFRHVDRSGRCLARDLASRVEPVRLSTAEIFLGTETPAAAAAHESAPTEIRSTTAASLPSLTNREVHNHD